jgi:hypothetical protein
MTDLHRAAEGRPKPPGIDLGKTTGAVVEHNLAD